MTIRRILKASAALPVVALLMLAGCGGGGGSAMAPPGTGTGMQPGTGTDMQPAPLEPARSAPSLGSQYSSEPARTYTPTVASVRDDQVSTAPFVSSIQRNAAGGFDIVYQDGMEQITVSVLPEHCQGNWAGCAIPADQNGRRYWFWSWTNPDSLGEPYEFKFLEASAFQADDGAGTFRRAFFVFGLETPASDVPATGEAIYGGRMHGWAHRTSEPGSGARQRYWGRVRLVANFDMSQLNGRIFSIQGTAPGEPSSARVSWPTSRFTITNGQISNGQFTATLTGADDDPTVPDAESVRGFVGSIVAKFYGPKADEFGGAITAMRDLQGTDNDRQFLGFVAGSKLAPRMLGSAAFATRVSRRFGDQETVLLADDGMATVVRTASGWNVTVGGRTFALSDSAFNADPRFPGAYFDEDNSGARYLGSVQGGFGPNSNFDHLDVKLWSGSEPGITDPNNVSSFVFLLHGNWTPAGGLPASGTGEYSGEMWAREWPSDQAVSSGSAAATVFRGDASMSADFGTASVTGTFSNLAQRPGNSRTYTSVNGGATFNAVIANDNTLSASDLAGTGALSGYQNGRVSGAFFGPTGEEMGGVYDAESPTENRIISGYFATRKDQ